MSVVAATANVGSLLPRQEDSHYSSVVGESLRTKAHILQRRFHDAGVQVLGIQEGRARRTAQSEGEYYHVLTAASDAGQYGCQVWIHKGLRANIESWEVVSARLMFAVFSSTLLHCSCVVIAAHAPHEWDDVAKKEAFWDTLSHLHARLVKLYGGALFFVCVDANARVGSIPSASIGPFLPDAENQNGTFFRTFLECAELMAANTFFQQGAGPSWVSPKGTRVRLDYCCIASRVFRFVRTTAVRHEIDLTLGGVREDHSAVSLEFDLGGAVAAGELGTPSICAAKRSKNSY